MNRTYTGVVKYFNPKSNHGKILSPDIDGEVYVHISEVQGSAVILLAGETVEFSLEQGKQSPIAKNLIRLVQRRTGEVIEFEKGKGTVECHQDGKVYSIYFRDFVGTDGQSLSKRDIRVKCESGEELEFSIHNDERFGEKASDIVMVDSRKPLEKFAYLPNFDTHLARLAQLSEENWNYTQGQSSDSYPVLKNYLYYTYSRLRREEKLFHGQPISFGKSSINWNGEERGISCSCFNTGLTDRNQQEIFAYFEENLNRKYSKDSDWVLKGFFAGNKGPMANFQTKPAAPDYMADLNSLCDLLFDPKKKLELCYDQLLEERETRFPASLRSRSASESMVIGALDMAVQKAIQRVKRNYKSAIPQYFNHKIQLLLPLCLESDDKVDLALVVELKEGYYQASAVLDLDKAYSNARLIARPDREWLQIKKQNDAITIFAEKNLITRVNPTISIETEASIQS